MKINIYKILLAQAVIMLHFGQINKNGNVLKDDKHEVDLLFLDASKIFEALEKSTIFRMLFGKMVCFL